MTHASTPPARTGRRRERAPARVDRRLWAAVLVLASAPRAAAQAPTGAPPPRSAPAAGAASSPVDSAGQRLPASRPTRRHLDASVAVRLGTLGAGVEIAKLVTSRLAVRGGYAGAPLTLTQTVSGVSYDARLRLGGGTLLADLYPAARGTFHLTAGAVFNRTRLTGSALPSDDGTISLNGQEYSPSELGRLTARVTFPAVAPYVGLGWGTPARKSAVALVTDIGVTLGAPTLSLGAAGAPANAPLRADLAAQQARTQGDIDRYARVLPVSSVGLVVRF